MAATISMRQRVKAKAPRWRTGMTAIAPVVAQQAAAHSAKRSYAAIIGSLSLQPM
jgi:hypothetical protein